MQISGPENQFRSCQPRHRLSGDCQLPSFCISLGSDWNSVSSGGCSKGVEIGELAGEHCPVADVDILRYNHTYQEHSSAITPNSGNYDGGNSGTRVGQTTYCERFQNMAGFRSQAEICFRRSELTTDRVAKLRWLTLAEAWLLMAESTTKKDIPGGSGTSAYQYLQREDDGALSQFLISSRANRRKYRRLPVLKEGKIANTDMRFIANVFVRDLSESGARVHLSANQALPDDFELYIVAERLLYPAVARWRDEWALGIQFVGEPRAGALHFGMV
jgi:hypothetical protein